MTVHLIRITAISYLNTIPFIYGIKKSGFLDNYLLELEVPSVSAQKILFHQSDIGLVPVALLKYLTNYQIITNYCIGAERNVKSVVLLSQKPLKSIKTIYLDIDSLTSVNLVKVLAKHFWKINPIWKPQIDINNNLSENIESMVAIGDKTFDLIDKFEYCYDLSEEWYQFSGLPFVFACWVEVYNTNKLFINSFSKSMEYGINNISKTMAEIPNKMYQDINVNEYLNKQISFNLDENKHKALSLFLKQMDQ